MAERPRLVLFALIASLAVPALRAQAVLEVSGLPDGAPLSLRAVATETALILDVALDAEWHMYARDVGGGEPVTVEVDGAFSASGPLEAPADPRGWITGQARLTLPIQANSDAGAGLIRARLRFQVCDPLQCLEPMEVGLSGTIAPLRVLLVVAAEDPRSERIAAWLAARGIVPTVTTYAAVDADACDAHDVVLADSKTFRDHGVGRDLIRAFPESETPTVAVGFLGTELVEAHGVAMTSGYI